MDKRVLVSIGAGTLFSEYARLLVIDLATKEIVKTFDYKHQIYEQSTKGFTGVFKSDEQHLWICTETEIFQVRLPDFEILKYHSATFFNDVHYCYFDQEEKKVYVVNTGLDAVEIFSEELTHLQSIALASHNRYTSKVLKTIVSSSKTRIIHHFSALEHQKVNENLFTEDKRYKNLTERVKYDKIKKHLFPNLLYDKEDLRYVLFRPHILHPNFIAKMGKTLLVTLKNTGEIVELHTRRKVIGNLKGPHDGVLVKNKFLITESGTGKLLYKDQVKHLNDIKNKAMLEVQVCNPTEGFIRGVDLLDDQIAIVAISKRREVKDEKPSWLAVIDLQQQRIIDRIEIPEKYGTNPFSVIDVSSCF